MRRRVTAIAAAVFAFATVGIPALRCDAAYHPTKSQLQSDPHIREDLVRSLNAARFKDVQVRVDDAAVTLSGTVELYAYKEEADRKVHHNQDVTAVQNDIVVAGPKISDEQLTKQIVEKLEYDRVGYGTTAFNAITVAVRNGTVSLGGHAYGPTDKDSAISKVSYMPGVRDVIDSIEVDPVSPMDDSIRIRTARAIYGYPALNKYALDPGRPIRISVQNGKVTLYGTVDSQADKDMAYIRANGVAGVFEVRNELQVAGAKPSLD